MKKLSPKNAKLSNHNENPNKSGEPQSEAVTEERQAECPQRSVEEMTILSIAAMKQANSIVENLAKTRAENKLSNSRVTSVARELKELIKVMSLYSC